MSETGYACLTGYDGDARLKAVERQNGQNREIAASLAVHNPHHHHIPVRRLTNVNGHYPFTLVTYPFDRSHAAPVAVVAICTHRKQHLYPELHNQ